MSGLESVAGAALLVTFVTINFVTNKGRAGRMEMRLDTFLPYRLNRLSEALSLEFRHIYRDRHGLNRPEWRVLVALADLGPATATQLCAHSAQHKTKVSRAVRALEERRWLTRATDPGDRRSEILTMTEAGRRVYGDLVRPMLAHQDAILGKLHPEERAALGTALASLEAGLGLEPLGDGDETLAPRTATSAEIG